MNLVYAALLFVVALLCALAGFTRIGVWNIERRFPATGEYRIVNDTKIHFERATPKTGADLPPVVFLHGASGNLHDQMMKYAPLLKGRAEMLFIDRPGHGYSSRGPASNAYPDGQAATIAALLNDLGIEKAIIVGHSFGGAIAASFALFHPEKTLATLYLSPATHPWPGGVSWYYELVSIPVIGPLFAQTLALPGGLMRIESGTRCVFAPNEPTPDYAQEMGAKLVLRPYHFINNGRDVANLADYVRETAPRYKEIKTPATIITGNKDTIVLASIHSRGLAKDMPQAKLIWIENLGHKSDHVVPDVVIAALENFAGAQNDLDAIAAAAQIRIANDNFGPVERCLDPNSLIAREILGDNPA